MPTRRPTATWNIEFEQQQLTGTIGYDPETGIPREAFFSTRAKAGTLLDGLLYDAGVLLSLALQYGTPATGWPSPLPVSKTAHWPVLWGN
jgi:hypothetical protein